MPCRCRSAAKFRRERGEEASDTERRQFLAATLGASGVITAYGSDGADDDRLLRGITGAYRHMECRSASRSLIEPVLAHLTLLARAEGQPLRRRELVASETAGLAAWLYADMEQPANARRYYLKAIKLAQRSGHALLPAYMQASMGQFEAYSGSAARALQSVGEARRDMPSSAPPIARVWLDVVEAVVLAEGRDERALTLLDTAERRLQQSSSTDAVWPWLFRFDGAKLASHRAQVNAKLGRAVAAREAFEAAGDVSRPRKARATTDLAYAHVLAETGQIEHACGVGLDVLSVGVRYHSDRLVHGVTRLHTRLARHRTAAVRQLGERLDASFQEVE